MSFLSKETIPRCNKLIFRPYIPIADHIVSHSVDHRVFLAIMDRYKLCTDGAQASHEVLTKYYMLDHVLCVRHDHKVECSVSYTQATYPDVDTGTELVAISHFELSPMCFPLNHAFHHERQMIVLNTVLEPDIVLELEILLSGIQDPKQRVKSLPTILEQIRNGLGSGTGSESESDDPAPSESEPVPEPEDPVISLSYNLVASPSKYYNALMHLKAICALR